MTAQRDANIDIESLRKNVRRRLDVFLFVSVIFLFLVVAAVVALVVTVLKQPQATVLQDRADNQQTAYKMGNFVYLEASSSTLANCTMSWDVVEHGNGTSKGHLYDFDLEHYSLQPKEAGVYFISLTSTSPAPTGATAAQGRLTVQVGDKLTCEVDLRSEEAPVTRKCWTVSHVNKQKLLAQMTVPKAGLANWKLELKGSGLGMFLVD